MDVNQESMQMGEDQIHVHTQCLCWFCFALWNTIWCAYNRNIYSPRKVLFHSFPFGGFGRSLAVSFLFRWGTKYRSSMLLFIPLCNCLLSKRPFVRECERQQMMLSWIGNQVVVLRVRSAIHIGTVTSIFGTCLMEHWDLVQNCWLKCSSSTCSDLRSSWENIARVESLHDARLLFCSWSMFFHVYPVLICCFPFLRFFSHVLHHRFLRQEPQVCLGWGSDMFWSSPSK